MPVTIKEAEHIAELSRLKFSRDELKNYTGQLNKILEYMEKLNELNTDNVEPLSYPAEGYNVFREDELKPSISRDEALKNATDNNDEFFKVPKVITPK